MDFNQVFNQQVEHLAKMAVQRGWVAYAKQRAQELEQDASGLFLGLTSAVRNQIAKLK
jgi:hypothetical protein